MWMNCVNKMYCLKKYFVLLFVLSAGTILLHAQQTERVYLSGQSNEDAVAWDFYCSAGMNSGKWSKIAVPSCWELQGFGKYDYGFAKDSVRGKETGTYKHRFKVPASWKGKIMNIVFEGVMTDATVQINGQQAGPVHQGAFYKFKYDISSKLKYGKENQLEVIVAKHSANKSVNAAEREADYWIFGGIFRPVWLEVLPAVHISQIKINATATGAFNTEFEAGTIDRAEIKIFNSNGQLVKQQQANFNNVRTYQMQLQINDVRQWNPESPEMYRAEYTVYKGGQPQHTVSEKFGFRTVEVKQRDGIYVNGVKIKFKGVNHHSFRPETGRTTSKKNSIDDVLLIKAMNMNAVRMAHYPHDKHFLEACDSLGLFVIDELAGWHGHYDTPTGTQLLKEMLDNDANHPSVIIWANGNEGGHNKELDNVFTEYDIQKRPVIHPWQLNNGIETQHYRQYNYGVGNYDNGREIVMPTEFLHGQYDGGHGAGLEDYWQKMWHNPLSAGGFLWDFADQAVVRKDLKDSLDTDKHRGADGIVGPHHEKEGSFYTVKEIWSPIFIERREITAGFDGKLDFENRYHYTNAGTCRVNWRLTKFNVQSQEEKGSSMYLPEVAPLQKGTIHLNLPAGWQQYDILYLTITDKDNREIKNVSYAISSPLKTATTIVQKKGKQKPEIQEADTLLFVKIKDVELTFNKNNGLLLQVKNTKGEIPFNNGPVIQEGHTNFANITYQYDSLNNLIITSPYNKQHSYNTLQWTIYPSGWIQMAVHYFPATLHTNMLGVNFSFPENEIKSVTYMGMGPYRVWKNRLKGGTLGLWNKQYNNTETGESWEYPEFKGYYANFYGGFFNTGNQTFTVATETEDLFLRLFSAAPKSDPWHNYEPLFPSGNISFMNAIPSIGSKTQTSATTGPMGLQNIFYDYEKDPSRALKIVVYFNFSVNR